MLPFLGDYLHAKSLRYWLIPSRNVDDQRIPQSDLTTAFRPLMFWTRIFPDILSKENYGTIAASISAKSMTQFSKKSPKTPFLSYFWPVLVTFIQREIFPKMWFCGQFHENFRTYQRTEFTQIHRIFTDVPCGPIRTTMWN